MSTKDVKYHDNPLINAVAVAALTGNKNVRADLTAILPELLRARTEEIHSERNTKTKEEALEILRKREGGKQ